MSTPRRCRIYPKERGRSKREEAVTTGKIMSANVPQWINTIVDEVLPSGKAGKQHFELNEEKSAIVRQICELFLNGLGCQSIARKLNLEKVPCLRRGKYWGPANVRAILSNQSLCGRYVQSVKKKIGETPVEPVVIENYFLPILTKSQYIEIQLLLKSNNNSKLRPDPTLANPLQGLCHCSICGALMTRVSQRAYRGRKPYQKLVCIGAKSGKHKCRSIEVDTIVGHLNMLMTFPQAFSFNNDDALIGLQTKRADYEMRITRLTNEMAIMGGSEAIRRALAGIEADLAALDKVIVEEAGKAVYANSQRMAGLMVEARAALGGASIGPSFADRMKGVPVGLATDRKVSPDALAVNGLLRRLFKGIKIDIDAGEVFCEWQDGKVSVLAV